MYFGNHVVHVLPQNKVPKYLEERRSEGVLPIPTLHQLSVPPLLGFKVLTSIISVKVPVLLAFPEAEPELEILL